MRTTRQGLWLTAASATLVLATGASAVVLASTASGRLTKSQTISARSASGSVSSVSTFANFPATGGRAARAWVVGSFTTARLEYLLLSRSRTDKRCVALAERQLPARGGLPSVIEESCDVSATKPFITRVPLGTGGFLLFGGVSAQTATVRIGGSTKPVATIGSPVDSSRFFTLWLPATTARTVRLNGVAATGTVLATQTVSLITPPWLRRSCGRLQGEARCPTTVQH